MICPYPNSFGFKRYYTFDYFLKTRFGEKVAKLPIDAGFTCPNIDGTRGVDGCIYCSPRGSGDFTEHPCESITEQLTKMREVYTRKWPVSHFIAYFQAHTNTYAPTERLRSMYEEALAFDGVIGLAIATRADCISESIADLLEELSKKTFLTVELGLQTKFDSTAKIINRCHTLDEFVTGYRRLKTRKINTCIHIINGLPGETPEMMLETARFTAALDPFAVKIHMLYVLRGTRLYDMYKRGELREMSREEYVEIVCDQLEVLPRDTVIERLTGDGKADELVSPLWSIKKTAVINEIDKEMRRRNSFQSKLRTEND